MNDIDTISEEAIEAGNKRGDELFDELLEMLEEGDENEASVVFSLWVNLSRLLAEQGWTADELSKDLHHHMEAQMTDGNA